MKALVYDRYGSPDELRLEEVERPTPGPGEVLLEVAAVSVNLSDWECLRGTPLYARIHGLLRPRHRILGSDIAGRVVAVGDGVSEPAVGDEVFGDALGTFGGFAEYACVPAEILVAKPAQLSFEQVATIPQASAIALHGLRTTGALAAGRRLLINGAGGGSGTFAIQIARNHGAEVTAVDHGRKLEHMRALGADHVIDYREVDFTATGERYDAVLDLVATRSIFAHRRALRPGGTYGMVGGTMRALLATLLLGAIVGRLSGTRLVVVGAETTKDDLATMLDLIVRGEVQVTIDRRFPLEQAAEAIRYHGEGRGCGKVVVVVGVDSSQPG